MPLKGARTSGHTCHAKDCKTFIPPRLLMCGRHWKMVDEDLKLEVWRYYENGQEDRMDPSPEYLQAAQAAIDSVAEKEGLLF